MPGYRHRTTQSRPSPVAEVVPQVEQPDIFRAFDVVTESTLDVDNNGDKLACMFVGVAGGVKPTVTTDLIVGGPDSNLTVPVYLNTAHAPSISIGDDSIAAMVMSNVPTSSGECFYADKTQQSIEVPVGTSSGLSAGKDAVISVHNSATIHTLSLTAPAAISGQAISGKSINFVNFGNLDGFLPSNDGIDLLQATESEYDADSWISEKPVDASVTGAETSTANVTDNSSTTAYITVDAFVQSTSSYRKISIPSTGLAAGTAYAKAIFGNSTALATQRALDTSLATNATAQSALVGAQAVKTTAAAAVTAAAAKLAVAVVVDPLITANGTALTTLVTAAATVAIGTDNTAIQDDIADTVTATTFAAQLTLLRGKLNGSVVHTVDAATDTDIATGVTNLAVFTDALLDNTNAGNAATFLADVNTIVGLAAAVAASPTLAATIGPAITTNTNTVAAMRAYAQNIKDKAAIVTAKLAAVTTARGVAGTGLTAAIATYAAAAGAASIAAALVVLTTAVTTLLSAMDEVVAAIAALNSAVKPTSTTTAVKIAQAADNVGVALSGAQSTALVTANSDAVATDNAATTALTAATAAATAAAAALAAAQAAQAAQVANGYSHTMIFPSAGMLGSALSGKNFVFYMGMGKTDTTGAWIPITGSAGRYSRAFKLTFMITAAFFTTGVAGLVAAPLQVTVTSSYSSGKAIATAGYGTTKIAPTYNANKSMRFKVTDLVRSTSEVVAAGQANSSGWKALQAALQMKAKFSTAIVVAVVPFIIDANIAALGVKCFLPTPAGFQAAKAYLLGQTRKYNLDNMDLSIRGVSGLHDVMPNFTVHVNSYTGSSPPVIADANFELRVFDIVETLLTTNLTDGYYSVPGMFSAFTFDTFSSVNLNSITAFNGGAGAAPAGVYGLGVKLGLTNRAWTGSSDLRRLGVVMSGPFASSAAGAGVAGLGTIAATTIYPEQLVALGTGVSLTGAVIKGMGNGGIADGAFGPESTNEDLATFTNTAVDVRYFAYIYPSTYVGKTFPNSDALATAITNTTVTLDIDRALIGVKPVPFEYVPARIGSRTRYGLIASVDPTQHVGSNVAGLIYYVSVSGTGLNASLLASALASSLNAAAASQILFSRNVIAYMLALRAEAAAKATTSGTPLSEVYLWSSGYPNPYNSYFGSAVVASAGASSVVFPPTAAAVQGESGSEPVVKGVWADVLSAA